MESLVRILMEGGHSLVVSRKTGNGKSSMDRIFTYDGRGVSDLLRLLDDEPDTLKGASLADKVVGKGAAALMALGKVKNTYAAIISEPALLLLRQEGIQVSYGKLVPHITNRARTAMCPVESRCLPCKTPAECLEQIKGFLKEMKEKNYKGGSKN